MADTDDPLWPHFKPRWLKLEKAGNGFLVAGGYGLFLKQQWLLGEDEQPIVIALERWPDSAPRATGDMDLVVALDLIADEDANRQLHSILETQGFKVSDKPSGKRWKFLKEIEANKHVLVELHAPLASDGKIADAVKADRCRVKNKRSLGEEGVHGRTNQEAGGCELHPFEFELEGVRISVPNSVTWTVMKLTAAEDNWKRSLEDHRESNDRKYYRDQAIKHGHDACRAVAMMTENERDSSGEVVQAIKNTPPFNRAAEIYRDFFGGEENWANEVLRDRWLPEDLEVIHGILASWYNA